MAPNPNYDGNVLFENEYEMVQRKALNKKSENENLQPKQYKKEIRWYFFILLSTFHIQSIYGAYLMLTSAKLLTTAFAFLLYLGSTFAIMAGAHRLWSHRAYKAKWQLKVLLMILQTVSGQDSIYTWVINHRVHHKYTDTDADPHNMKRGFFFSHIGWLLIQPHPDFLAKRKAIDMSDIKSDPVVSFQIRYYGPLVVLLWAVTPTVIPWYIWNETLINSWFIAVALRTVFSLNATFFINSWAHMWGSQPYDTDNSARETIFVSVATLGEGWHNYHHTFPWDYRAGELSGGRNISAFLLKQFAKIGWAYDLKTVSVDMIQKRVQRTGDGSYSSTIWGWGDCDQSVENKNCATIENF